MRCLLSLAGVLALATGVSAFVVPPSSSSSSTERLHCTKLSAKSRAVPFLDAPKALDGSLVGDVGFDPLNLSDLDIDFSYLIVPTKWEESRTGLPALKWFRESELKHGRIAMLAVLGWVAVDLGLRFPGSKYAGLTSYQAHDALVKSGDMFVGLVMIGIIEVIMGVAIYEMSKGSDRAPGDFEFDPLGLGKGEKSRFARYALSELKNGRLAMLSLAGIATQAALTDSHTFPYY